MQRLPEDKIDPENPWEGDKLERKAVAERLTKILETSSGPLVVSVTAPFGMGKTFFSKRWQADLERQGKPAIYFNVWETDFAADPLLPLLQVITQYVEDLDLPSTKKKDIIEKAANVTKTIAPALFRVGLKVGLKAISGGIIDGKVDTLAEGLAVAGLSEVEQLASAKMNSFITELSSRQSFKEQLAELRELILESKEKSPADNKIYIFVDELDRCRPPYALEFLETVKHLFDVEGFVFILCVDEGALQNTAQQIYGAPTEGEGYLRKFIDFRFQLPPPSYMATAEYLYDKYRLAEIITENDQDIFFGRLAYVTCFSKWAQLLNLTVRQQSDVFNLLNTTLRYLRTQHSLPAIPIVGLVVIKEIKPKVWVDYQFNFSEFKSFYNELWIKKTCSPSDEWSNWDASNSEWVDWSQQVARNCMFQKNNRLLDSRDEKNILNEIGSLSGFNKFHLSQYMDKLYHKINLTADPK